MPRPSCTAQESLLVLNELCSELDIRWMERHSVQSDAISLFVDYVTQADDVIHVVHVTPCSVLGSKFKDQPWLLLDKHGYVESGTINRHGQIIIKAISQGENKYVLNLLDESYSPIESPVVIATPRSPTLRKLINPTLLVASEKSEQVTHWLLAAPGGKDLYRFFLELRWSRASSGNWYLQIVAPCRRDLQTANNKTEWLREIHGTLVRVEVYGSDATRILRSTTRFDFDSRGNKLVSGPILTDISNPAELVTDDIGGVHLSRLGLVTAPRASTVKAEIQVSFPVIGNDIPVSSIAEEYWRDSVTQSPPHWFYHVAVTVVDGASKSLIPEIPDDTIQTLAEYLNLNDVVPGKGLRVEPREFTHEDICPDKCSPFAFAPIFSGNSYQLPVATGLVAASANRPLPPWIVMSGGVRGGANSELRLDSVGQLINKIKLCFGKDNAYDVNRVYEVLYFDDDRESTQRYLGNRALRTGNSNSNSRVRLMIVPKTIDATSAQLEHEFDINEDVDLSSIAVGYESFGDLRDKVLEIAQEGILVVQVDTVFDALQILGYYHHPTVESRNCVLNMVKGFVVQPRASSDLSSRIWARKCNYLRRLRESFSREEDVQHAFFLAVKECVMILGGDSGSLAFLDSNKTGLEVVTRCCNGHTNLPKRIPAELSVVPPLLQSWSTIERKDLAQDTVFMDAITASRTSPYAQLYEEEHWDNYIKYLKEIRACLKFPLKCGEEIVGILGINRNRPGRFDHDSVAIVEALCIQLSNYLATYLQNQARPREQLVPDSPNINHLLKQVRGLSASQVQRKISDELAAEAIKRFGARRALVRLVMPFGQILQASGLAGDGDAWPDEVLDQAISLSTIDRSKAVTNYIEIGGNYYEDCAATHAIRQGKSYYIEETNSRKDSIHFFPVQPNTGSHAAVLIQAGSVIVGVLSVDWQQTRSLGYAIQQQLESLACKYGTALKAYRSDHLFNQIDHLMQSDEETVGCKNRYQEIVKLVGETIGSPRGSLFLRKNETGNFHLAASLLHPEWSDDDCFYKPGEGVTGWIGKNNKLVRVLDLRNEEELREISPNIRWTNKFYDGPGQGDWNHTFLGVPVAVGDDVYGVMRFSATGSEQGFDSQCAQIAMAVASRLASLLCREDQSRRFDALRDLYVRGLKTISQNRYAEILFETICKCLGPTLCEIRRLEPGLSGYVNLTPLADNLSVGQFLSSPDELENQVIRQRDLAQSANRMCIPLLVREELQGTLFIERQDGGHFTTADSDFLDDVAVLAANGLHGLRCRQESAIKVGLLETLCQQFTISSETKCLTPVLKQLNNLISKNLDVDASQLWLLNQETSQFYCRTHAGSFGSDQQVPQSAVHDYFSDSNVLVVNKPMEDDRLSEFIPCHANTRRRGGILLTIDGRTIALFLVFTVHSRHLSQSRLEWVTELLEEVLAKHCVALSQSS